MMPSGVERVFLGWDRPALYGAVNQLVQRRLDGDKLDLSRVLVVVPGRRAGRRLQELLALECAGRPGRGPWTLLPPRVVTPSGLPDELFEHSLDCCTDMEGELARVLALQNLAPDKLKILFPTLPDPEDFGGWLGLAAEIGELDRELAGEDVNYLTVAEACRRRGLQESRQRWLLLHQIWQATMDRLAAVGRVDAFEMRRRALLADQWKPDWRVVLLAGVDLPLATVHLLEAFAARAAEPVLSLIHAPAELETGFDPWGRLEPAYWAKASIPISDEGLHIADHPRDELLGVRHALRVNGSVPDSQITVGMGDESLGGALLRAVEAEGRSARWGAGTEVGTSSPVQLLRLLAEYASQSRPEAFAALLRHPDLEAWLNASFAASEVGTGPGLGSWPAAWDTYLNQRLPVFVAAGNHRLGEALGWAVAKIEGLWLGEGAKRGSRLALGEWTTLIGNLLAEVYRLARLDPGVPSQAATVYALETIGDALGELEPLVAEHPFGLRANFPQVVSLLLERVASETLPPPGGEECVELTGWLDVHLDDAPLVLLTGFNEGFIPQSVNGAPFLPDGLRLELGLLDNGRRYARDAYWLSAILASRAAGRGQVQLYCSRSSAGHDRLAPSRLIFACDDGTLVRRTLKFYTETTPEPEVFGEVPSEHSLQWLARPAPLTLPLTSLRVTAFKDHLACPYRFYLKHVLGLEQVEDGAVEMGADIFGSLLHSVLQSYGKWVIEVHDGYPPPDAEVNFVRLSEILAEVANRQFGSRRLPAVSLQLHQLERRLKAFAKLHAGQTAEGWQIVQVECDARRVIEVDGEPFEIRGRIDRVDFHAGENRHRILDYKSGDSGLSPERTHRDKHAASGWSDLQLPLYRRMAPSLGIAEADVEVGYITLPKDVESVKLEMASWEAPLFEEAYRVADDVIRAVRAQEFWPPREPPRFPDGLKGLCLDRVPQRREIIDSTGDAVALWAQQTTPPGGRYAG